MTGYLTVYGMIWGEGGGCIVGLELSCSHPSQSFSMSLCGPNFLLSAYGTMGNLQPMN